MSVQIGVDREPRPLMPRVIRAHRGDFFIATIATVLFYVAGHHLLHVGLLAYGDNIPPYESARVAFTRFLYGWQPSALGQPREVVLQDLMQGPLVALFGPTWTQRAFMVGVLPLGFVSAYVLAGLFTRLRVARFVAGMVYALNPATIGDFSGGTIFSVLLGHALLPLAVYGWIRVFRRRDDNPWRTAAVTALASAAVFVTSYTGVFILGITVILIGLVTLGPLAWRRQLRRLVPFVGRSVIVVLLVFALTAPFTMALVSRVPLPGSSRQADLSLGQFKAEMQSTFGPADAATVLRLGGVGCAFGYCRSVDSTVGPARWALFGFVLPLFIFGVVAAGCQVPARPFVIFILLSCALFSLLFVLRSSAMNVVVDILPLLAIFRNPTGLLLGLALGLSMLLALSVGGVQDRFGSRATLAAVVVLGCSWACYMHPAFNGSYGLSNNAIDAARVPASVLELAKTVHGRRTAVLPNDYELNELPARGSLEDQFNIPFGTLQFFSVPSAAVVTDTLNAIADPLLQRGALQLLSLWGVSSLAIDSAVQASNSPGVALRYDSPYLQMEPSELLEISSTIKHGKMYVVGGRFVVVPLSH